jgi:hypothetical protein
VWTEDDVEYALEWQALNAASCPGCGEPKSESFDAANASAYDVHPLRCHACAAREETRDDYSDQGGSMAGLFLTVSRRRGIQ